MTRASTRILLFGSAIALSGIAASPAAAQYGSNVQCPPGYYFSSGYGCIPQSDAYDDLYSNDYGYGAPVYDGFGLAFGFGGYGGGGRGVGDRGGHGGGGGHIGGGGGGHMGGGGGHGGGGGGGHGGGGGGHR